MDGWGIVLWILIAAVIGAGVDVAATYILKRGSVTTAVYGFLAALLGSLAWSEWFGKASNWGGNLEGLQVLPAILGAAILSLVQILGTRFAEEEAVAVPIEEEQELPKAA